MRIKIFSYSHIWYKNCHFQSVFGNVFKMVIQPQFAKFPANRTPRSPPLAALSGLMHYSDWIMELQYFFFQKGGKIPNEPKKLMGYEKREMWLVLISGVSRFRGLCCCKGSGGDDQQKENALVVMGLGRWWRWCWDLLN